MFFRRKRTIDSLRGKIHRDELRRRSRILVIDDERPDLVDDLERAGFAVTHMPDVTNQNLSVLDQPLFDLILLDFGNVGTTIGSDEGLSLLRHIKRINPATIVLAYTSKALAAGRADFFRLADGVLAKDAGVAESMEKIEESLQRAHSIDNVWRGLLNVSGVQPGSPQDAEWQDLAVQAVEKPSKIRKLKERMRAISSDESAQKIGLILLEKVIEIGVKSAVGH